MNRRPVHRKAHRAVLFVAIVFALSAVAAVLPGTASADGRVCPNGYPWCTWAYTPYRFPIEDAWSPDVYYGGIGNYNGYTVQVCITIRLLISDSSGGNNRIVGEKKYCHPGPTDTSTNVYGNVRRDDGYIYYYHTWAHSWQVWADGHAHNDRYVASERIRL